MVGDQEYSVETIFKEAEPKKYGSFEITKDTNVTYHLTSTYFHPLLVWIILHSNHLST